MDIYCNQIHVLISIIYPLSNCGVIVERVQNSYDLMECNNCNTHFCYGCNFIFRYSAEVEWICTCMLLPKTNHREYKHDSLYSCKKNLC